MADRKPLSKRTRFEVFKRDGFVCQYCGAHPPAVLLEVDHIIALANGGTDDEDNLVTSCEPCNRGKAAVPLTVVPQSLADKAAEVAEREEQIRGYNQVLQDRRDRIEEDVWRVVEHWTGEAETTRDKFRSLTLFVDKLGVHEVLEAVDIVKSKHIYGSREWKYFCGICWKKIRDAEL